jgi:acyl carrier protein
MNRTGNDGRTAEQTADTGPVLKLRAMFSDILHTPENEIDIDQNIFEMGMDSILIVRLVLDIERNFGIQISITRIFEIGEPTPRNIAKLLAEK